MNKTLNKAREKKRKKGERKKEREIDSNGDQVKTGQTGPQLDIE